jgi:hypothetical protein
VIDPTLEVPEDFMDADVTAMLAVGIGVVDTVSTTVSVLVAVVVVAIVVVDITVRDAEGAYTRRYVIETAASDKIATLPSTAPGVPKPERARCTFITLDTPQSAYYRLWTQSRV